MNDFTNELWMLSPIQILRLVHKYDKKMFNYITDSNKTIDERILLRNEVNEKTNKLDPRADHEDIKERFDSTKNWFIMFLVEQLIKHKNILDMEFNGKYFGIPQSVIEASRANKSSENE